MDTVWIPKLADFWKFMNHQLAAHNAAFFETTYIIFRFEDVLLNFLQYLSLKDILRSVKSLYLTLWDYRVVSTEWDFKCRCAYHTRVTPNTEQ